jgi:hypothetical protein
MDQLDFGKRRTISDFEKQTIRNFAKHARTVTPHLREFCWEQLIQDLSPCHNNWNVVTIDD